jgi:hypothetical protein
LKIARLKFVQNMQLNTHPLLITAVRPAKNFQIVGLVVQAGTSEKSNSIFSSYEMPVANIASF